MTITILFFHQGILIRLVVRYVPALDGADVEGIWDQEQNKIALSWRLFSEFKNERDHRKRKAMIASLRKVDTAPQALH